MTVGQVRVMCGHFVLSCFMVHRGFLMVPCCMFVMLCCLLVMLCCLFGHKSPLGDCISKFNRVNTYLAVHCHTLVLPLH